MEKIEVININELIKEVNSKYIPLKLSTKNREVTEEESNQLFELSTKLELFKIIKSLFMEEFTKNEKLIKFLLESKDPEHKLTTHKEKAKDKNNNEVEVEVFDQSMEERISMMPKDFAKEIFEKLVKSHKQNIDIYTKKNELQLLKKEQYELDIINEFLPKEATKEDIINWLNENYPNGFSMKEMGPIIGRVKKSFERSDGKMISEVVKSMSK